MKVRLLGGVEGRSTNVAPEKAINLYYEQQTNGEQLVSTPGVVEWSDFGDGEVRGSIDYNGNAWFVVGNKLYEVDANSGSTLRGTLTTSTGRVSMAHNGTRDGANQQLMVVDGSAGWIWDNVAKTFTQITDSDYTNTTSVVYIDGYFIYAQIGTDRFWLTNLFDGTTIDSTDFTTAEGAPDKIQALVADNRELYVFGEETLEVFYNSGDPDQPFQRYQGGFKQTGCAAKFTPNRFDNTILWLTANERGSGQVAALGGNNTPQIISSPELDYQISTYSRIDDAFSYVYQYQGNEFYTLVFPTEQKTWTLNARTKRWHQEGHVIDDVFPNRVRYNCHTFAHGKHLLGDVSNGKIYAIDRDSSTLAGARVPREVVTPILTEKERRIRLSSVQLDMQEGIGDQNAANDARVWLSYSKDGGKTFSDEIDADMGDEGQYKKRVLWRHLGQGRNWSFRIRTWTPNPVVMKSLYARPYGGR